MTRSSRHRKRIVFAAAAALALTCAIGAETASEHEVPDPAQPAAETPAEDTEEDAAPTEDASTQQAMLKILYQAADAFSGKVEVPEDLYLTVADLLDAYEELKADPTRDFVSGIEYAFRENALDERECSLTSFELHYLVEEADRPGYAEKLSAALDEIVAAVEESGAQTEGDRVLSAYDAILSRCTGTSGSTSTLFCAYGCLVEHRAVGKGFADAFYLVMEQLGIPCIVVSQEDGGTWWNMAQVDGAWYHANLYWDSRDADDGEPTHLFCLVADEDIRKVDSKPWTAPYTAPTGYFYTLPGSTREDRLAFAGELWHRIVDEGHPTLEGVEAYRLTYDEVMDAYDAYFSGPRWSYVSSHGGVYLSSSSLTDGRRYIKTLAAEYRLSPEEIRRMDEVLEEGITQATADAVNESDTYLQVLSVHDWLVRNLSYDQDGLPASHTPYGAFANRLAVCDGYAYAFQLAMERLGIPCVSVRSAEMDHRWNMVCLDGTWYHVDVTWDDPAPDQGPDAEVSHGHLLLSDATMYALGYYGWEGGYEAPTDWWG